MNCEYIYWVGNIYALVCIYFICILPFRVNACSIISLINNLIRLLNPSNWLRPTLLTINIQISLAIILLYHTKQCIKAHATVSWDNSRTRNCESLIHSSYSLRESPVKVCIFDFAQLLNFLPNSLLNPIKCFNILVYNVTYVRNFNRFFIIFILTIFKKFRAQVSPLRNEEEFCY